MQKLFTVLALIALALILAFVLQKSGCIKTMTPEELKTSIEIVDVETKWVAKYYQPWPPILTLVPAISFRVKNVSDQPLRYINFNATFKFKDDFENLGDNFLAAIRKDPVMPDKPSDVITLKSNYGVEGKNLDSFKNNPQWKTVFVKLFAQSKGSQYVLFGEWVVSKHIDFEEPEPVGIKKEEDQPEDELIPVRFP